jgi:hypothetical protein
MNRSRIYTPGCIHEGVKFIYCAKCKELRVKPWYARRVRCGRCRGEGKEITVPKSGLSYLVYVMMVFVTAAAIMNVNTDDNLYFYLAIVGVVALMVVEFIDISRGEKYARARIRPTTSDVGEFRKRGWS